MPQAYSPLPPLEGLQQLIAWNPATGELIWKITQGSARTGAQVGAVNNCGYLSTSIKGKRYLVHRLIWLFATGEDPGQMQIDHINGDRLDNRMSNLRICERLENNKNVKTHKDGIVGHLGISEHKPGVYRVRIMRNGKNHHVGLFRSLDAAIAARQKAELEFHGEFSSHVSRSANQAQGKR